MDYIKYFLLDFLRVLVTILGLYIFGISIYILSMSMFGLPTGYIIVQFILMYVGLSITFVSGWFCDLLMQELRKYLWKGFYK